jgi:hypothetical protein
MDRDQIVKMVDEATEALLEGGPGSGRYPAGSGKHPDSDGGKGGEHPKEYERKDPTWDDKHREHMKINSRHADIISKKAERGYTTHDDARDSHRVAANIAEKYGATKLVSYHREKEKYHKSKDK